jgi:hypothetical protein
MAMNKSQLRELYVQRIYAGLQREFSEVQAVAGYGGTANDMWMRLARAIADIAMDTVDHIQSQAEVLPGIPSTPTKTVGTGKIN